MVMMISKFHRLIQSRLLWLAFLVVIIFSFVIWGSQVSGSSDRRPAASSPGRLDGKAVPAEEFGNAWHNVYLSLVLSMGRPPPQGAQLDALINDMAWKRLVSLREARRLGIVTGDDELLAFIQQLPPFQRDGGFSKDAYRIFVQNALSGLRYDESFFAEHLREELTLDKLRRLVDATALVPPGEVDAALRRYTDQLTVEYLVIPRTQAAAEVTVTEEDARAEFDANPVKYALPPRVRVRAAWFPHQPYLEQIPPIPEASLEDYYAANTAEFRVPAPGLPPEDGDPATPRMVLAPFEVVRADIERKLRDNAARMRARDDADTFWRRTAPDIADYPVPFDEAVRAENVRVLDFDSFNEGDSVAGFAPGSAFHRAAFSLREDTPADTFSEPIAGETGYYVLSLAERIPPRIPAFEDVAEQALSNARDRRIAETAERKAREAADAVRGGRPLAEVAATLGVEAKTTPSFTLMTGLQDLDVGRQLVGAALAANVGETPDPVPLSGDRWIVLRVTARADGDPESMAGMRSTVAGMIRRERFRLAFETWQEYLLRRANFEDQSRRATDDEG